MPVKESQCLAIPGARSLLNVTDIVYMWKFVCYTVRVKNTWGLKKMAAILQTTFSNNFSGMQTLEFPVAYQYLNLFIKYQRSESQISDRWLSQWSHATNHYLKQSSMTPYGISRPQWVKLAPCREHLIIVHALWCLGRKWQNDCFTWCAACQVTHGPMSSTARSQYTTVFDPHVLTTGTP